MTLLPYVPAGGDTHTLFWKHTDPPGYPSGHAVWTPGENVPLGHAVHNELPCTALNVPLLHCVHHECVASVKNPAGQAPHAVAPASDAAFPYVHWEHAESPGVSATSPLVQDEHTVDIDAPEYFPATQFAHTELDDADE